MATKDLFGDQVVTFYGKYDWYTYAKDCMITFVFPGGIVEKKPALAYWQWDQDTEGNHSTCALRGTIDVVSTHGETKYIYFNFSYYWFDGTIKAEHDLYAMDLVMRNPSGGTSQVHVHSHYPLP